MQKGNEKIEWFEDQPYYPIFKFSWIKSCVALQYLKYLFLHHKFVKPLYKNGMIEKILTLKNIKGFFVSDEVFFTFSCNIIEYEMSQQ